MKNLNTAGETAQDAVIDDLIRATGHIDNIISKYPTEEEQDIIREFCATWDASPCDPQGASVEQDAHLDSLLEEYADKLLAIKTAI